MSTLIHLFSGAPQNSFHYSEFQNKENRKELVQALTKSAESFKKFYFNFYEMIYSCLTFSFTFAFNFISIVVICGKMLSKL